MIRGFVRITGCVLAAAIAFSGIGLEAQAAGMASVLPNSGVNITLSKGTTLENLQQESGDTTKKVEAILDRAALEEARKEAGIQAALAEEEELSKLVIAQVNHYVNVRSLPSEEGEVLGKLYDKSVGTYLSEENGWYQISSGTVTGYVKAEYCVTGKAAVELAKQVCTRFAKVDTETLKVRTKPSMEASVLTLVPYKEELVVSEEVEGWAKVDTSEGTGWVSTDYVVLSREFKQAESKAEEAARLAKEAEERRKANEAAAKASKKKSNVTYTVDTSTGSQMGQAVAEYALQFVGNPYVYGGTSLTKGADCSGFVMSVYANFGVSLPHSSAAHRKQGYAVDGLNNAQPGDLICYSGHVALYIGNGQIVHAANSRKGIIVSKADYQKILAVRRIF